MQIEPSGDMPQEGVLLVLDSAEVNGPGLVPTIPLFPILHSVDTWGG
jgi:hypothetical protein